MISYTCHGYSQLTIGHLIEQPFVPVTAQPMHLISKEDDEGIEENDDDRAAMAMPYDIGLPVCSVAETIWVAVPSCCSRANPR